MHALLGKDADVSFVGVGNVTTKACRDRLVRVRKGPVIYYVGSNKIEISAG
jgi:hypothetical protein